MNNYCLALIIISIVLFVLVYVFFPDKFTNFNMNDEYFGDSEVTFKDSESNLDNLNLNSTNKDKNESKNDNLNKDSDNQFNELVNEAKIIKDKLDSETPNPAEISKLLKLSDSVKTNKFCNSAPDWWHPIDKYDPNNFKEKVDYKNFIPVFDYLGDCQEVYWDFKQQLIK